MKSTVGRQTLQVLPAAHQSTAVRLIMIRHPAMDGLLTKVWSLGRSLTLVAAFAAAVIICVMCGSFVWQVHFWVPEGTAIPLGKWRYEDFEFMVWQRKNHFISEPFADGLFVRRSTNNWEVFCFDFQDNYNPKIELRRTGETVTVLRDGENRGVFDMAAQVFRREKWYGAIYLDHS